MNKADPRIFLIGYLLFFALGSRVLSETAALVVIAGGIFFAAGVEISGRFGIRERNIRINGGILWFLFLIASAAVLIDIYRIGGLPVLKPSLLAMHKASYVMLGLLAVPIAALALAGGTEKPGWKKAAMPASAVALTVLIGYRTNIIASVLAFSLILYALGAIKRKKLFLLIVAGLFLLLGASWLKVLASGSGASPIEALFYRVEGTVSIFSRIADQHGGSADGKIIGSAFTSLTGIGGPQKGPRTIMAEMFGARESITFTTSMLGEPYLDFGIAGVIALMLLLGLVLGGLSKAKKPVGTAAYSVLLAYSLVEIETGILDMILFYYLAGALYLLASVRIRKAKAKWIRRK